MRLRFLCVAALAACGRLAAGPADADWPAYGGGPENLRYSALDQIDRSSVRQLQPAWTYHTGDPGETQCQPIVVRRRLYCTSARLKAFALDAASGTEIWSFAPEVDQRHVNRGVVYWDDGEGGRILYTAGSRLYALDAETGIPVASFGESGSIDLRAGLGEEHADAWVVATTPGVVFEDLLIQGTRVTESDGAAPGWVRAFDLRSGALRWTFHTIPRPGEEGSESWAEGALVTAGGANSWAGMSVDTARAIVYVPTGSATPDFYGGSRHGENLFANTLLALDARTGRRIWHFQTVHHDLWDRDLPAPPNLVSVNGVDAVAQITKSGLVFLFDRESGAPLFPIEERPVPPSDLRGESAWPTQPFPVAPEPFARQRLDETEVTDLSPQARAGVLERLRMLRSGGQFVPPSEQGSIVFPGFDGGGEWGGSAVDPATGVLYVNASEMPWIAAMVGPSGPAVRTPAELYQAHCAGCHSAGGRGPSLEGIAARRGAAEIRRVIDRGAGFMPAFTHLGDEERRALVAYLIGGEELGPVVTSAPSTYRFRGYERFLDHEGYPAVKPPWGTLNAIDLGRGEILWKVPLGEFPELTARGIPVTGTENYGGPLVTAGGLVFIAASRDASFRAFDSRSGEILWEAPLPAGGYATPATYSIDGRQYVVIAAGGGKMGTPTADAFVAFSLP